MGFLCVFWCVEAGFCVLRLVALGFAQIVLAGESSGCNDKLLWSWWFPVSMEQVKMRKMGAKIFVGIFVGCFYMSFLLVINGFLQKEAWGNLVKF